LGNDTSFVHTEFELLTFRAPMDVEYGSSDTDVEGARGEGPTGVFTVYDLGLDASALDHDDRTAGIDGVDTDP
jgi:hypothetical protein